MTTIYTTNDMNEYTQAGNTSYAYNADGDIISATNPSGTTTYAYSQNNQLVGVATPGGDKSTYIYNVLGYQVAFIENGQQVNNLIDPSGLGNVVGQFDSSNEVIADYTYGTGLASRVSAQGTAAYYSFDLAGDTIGITNSTGLYVNQYSYLPFGQTTTLHASLPNLFTFAGSFGVSSDGSGLFQMRERDYDADVGRFSSPDAAGLNRGDQNPYRYVDNDPTESVDPSGLRKDWFGVAVGFGVVVVGSVVIGAGTLAAPTGAGAIIAVPVIAGGAVIYASGIGLENAALHQPDDTPNGQMLNGNQILELPQEQVPQLPREHTSSKSSLALVAAESGIADDGLRRLGIPEDAAEIILETSIAFVAALAEEIGHTSTDAVTSQDPNSLTGSAGHGVSNFIAPITILPYTIHFENAPTATAPAQRVVITDQLDPNLDWSTLQLTGVGLNDTNIILPVNSRYYATAVPITENGKKFDVDITISFDPATGLLTAVLQSINPATQLPPEILTGFLPPEDGTGRGMGFISFIVDPKTGMPTGTQIRNVALITFDANPAIATDQVNDEDPTQGIDPTKQALVTIDAGPPTSSVGPLPPEEVSTSFNVTWSGHDDPGGSGIASYDIYVSTDGGSYTLWRSDTTATSATFAGQAGDSYSFYSVTTDNVGNVQATRSSAQATTEVASPLLSITSIAPVAVATRNTPVTSPSVTLSEPAGPSGFTSSALTLTDNGGPNLITGAVSVTLVSGSTYLISGLSGLTTAEGNYTLKINAAEIDDSNSIAGSGLLSTSWLMDTTPPTSDVSPLPSQTTSTSFTVTVTGSDAGGAEGSTPSGVASYAIYVSTDNGPFTLLTTVSPSDPSATFTGHAGDTYGFYSIATDQAGNVQPTPEAAQTTTTVINTPTPTPSPTPTPTPPPLVTVQSLQVETIKVGTGKNAKKETVLVVDFSGALNGAAADNAGAYVMAPIIKVKASGKGKNHKPATTKLGALVPLASAVYSPSNNSVTLTPRGKLTALKPEELIVGGALLTDALGREIDGAAIGLAGSDYVATISGTRVTPGGIPLAQTERQRVGVVDAIDALLSGGRLTAMDLARRG